MTGSMFREARLRAGLSIRAAATQIGVAPATIVRWEAAEDAEITHTAAARIASQETPAVATVAYALGRVLRCCADIWEDTGDYLPNDLSQQFPVHPSRLLGPLLTRARARSERLYREVEPEIESHLRRIPEGGVPAQLSIEEQGPLWLGYYHRGADRRQVTESERDAKTN